MATRFEQYSAALQLPAFMLKIPAGLGSMFATLIRSDHAAFWEASYPAVIIGDTGLYRNANYHCAAGPDSVDRLNHDFSFKVIKAVTSTVFETLKYP